MTRCHASVTISVETRLMRGNPSAEAGPILVVDDDPKIAHLVRAYLEREGFAVASAGDGIAALAAVRERPPRLIVLDIMLPELDGLSVARRVREESDVPILMLSARGSVAERVHGIAEGADDYLPKPFSPAELVVRVKAILRRAAIGRETREPLRLGDLVIDRGRRIGGRRRVREAHAGARRVRRHVPRHVRSVGGRSPDRGRRRRGHRQPGARRRSGTLARRSAPADAWRRAARRAG